MKTIEKPVKKSNPTVSQFEHLRQMAIDKGVSQKDLQSNGIDNGLFATALDAVKSGNRIKLLPPIEAPAWAQLHFITVQVKLDEPWNDAVRAAGPDTPSNYSVWKVGDRYAPQGTGVHEAKLVLVNLANGDFNKAVRWADELGLKRTNPRHVFAIGSRHLEIKTELGIDPAYIVASEECTFVGNQQVCFVWWYGSGCRATLGWSAYVSGPRVWVAFLCE